MHAQSEVWERVLKKIVLVCIFLRKTTRMKIYQGKCACAVYCGAIWVCFNIVHPGLFSWECKKTNET